jgi:excisionase family DNA binding protein
MEDAISDWWLSVEEAVAYLGIKRHTVCKWIDRKAMPAHKVGRLWKFRKEQIDEWVGSGRAANSRADLTRRVVPDGVTDVAMRCRPPRFAAQAQEKCAADGGEQELLTVLKTHLVLEAGCWCRDHRPARKENQAA